MAPRPSVSPSVWCKESFAALDWLERAFGFERSLVVTGDDGDLITSETRVGEGYIIVSPDRGGDFTTPAALGGRYTASIQVQLDDDIDLHHSRAMGAGGVIVRPIATQPYGDRVYIVSDPEGHVWSFGQTLAVLTTEEQAAATGRRIESTY